MCSCLFVTIIKLADNKALLYFRKKKQVQKNSIYFLYCFAYILTVCFAYFAIISWPVLTGGNNISISTMFLKINLNTWNEKKKKLHLSEGLGRSKQTTLSPQCPQLCVNKAALF